MFHNKIYTQVFNYLFNNFKIILAHCLRAYALALLPEG